MSRIAKVPVTIPEGVELKVDGQQVSVKGKNGELNLAVNDAVEVITEDNTLRTLTRKGFSDTGAQAGTARSLISNMVIGVTEGFKKHLKLVGVGYRAQTQGNTLNLSLGFSHPVVVEVPKSLKVETPTQTEIVLSGADKQLLGQVAANIRAYRPPEPYKGKGVHYANEQIRRKEAKKK